MFVILALLFGAQSVAAQNINGAYTQFPSISFPRNNNPQNSTITVNPPAHSAFNRAQDATMATDFCSAGESTGASDATACLQAAVNTICNYPAPGTRQSNGGGLLYIPAGTYSVNGTVQIPCQGVKIVGAGFGDRDDPKQRGTMISGAGGGSVPANAPVFETAAPASAAGGFGFGFTLRDLMIYNAGNARTGALVKISNLEDVFVDGVYFFAPCTAVRVESGNGIYFTNVRSESSLPNCEAFQLTGAKAARQTTDVVSFQRVQVSAGSGSACYGISNFVQTVWWSNTVCETSGYAIHSICTAATDNYGCPGFYTLNDFESESFGNGYNLIDITDLVDGFKMTDSWLRGRGGAGSANNLISITPLNHTSAGNLMVNITSSWLKYAGRNCANIISDNVMIAHNQIFGCNGSGVNAYGVNLTSHRATITGNTFCADDWISDIGNPMGGVQINSGSDYVSLTGNVFSGSVGGRNNGCSVAWVNNGLHFAQAGNTGP